MATPATLRTYSSSRTAIAVSAEHTYDDAGVDGRPALLVVPCTITEAKAFVREHHRHRAKVVSGLFAVAVADDVVRGVAIVGRPVSRVLDADDFVAEITRVCTDGARNACSMLYGACWRAARALGYRRVVTYTGKHEPGSSLTAAGFVVVGEVTPRSWHCPSRPRVDTSPRQAKLRWERAA